MCCERRCSDGFQSVVGRRKREVTVTCNYESLRVGRDRNAGRARVRDVQRTNVAYSKSVGGLSAIESNLDGRRCVCTGERNVVCCTASSTADCAADTKRCCLSDSSNCQVLVVSNRRASYVPELCQFLSIICIEGDCCTTVYACRNVDNFNILEAVGCYCTTSSVNVAEGCIEGVCAKASVNLELTAE